MKKTQTEQSNGWGIASFVTSILGGLLFIMPYFGIIFSIFAMVAYGLQKPKTGLATAGLILGILGTIVNLVMLLLIILFMSIAYAY
jgi:hypothetical protein